MKNLMNIMKMMRKIGTNKEDKEMENICLNWELY